MRGDETGSHEPSNTALSPGTSAPEFTLPSGSGGTLSLTDLHGRPAILAFYPADWSPTCDDRMALYNGMPAVSAEFDARLVGVSVDGVRCHEAFAADRNLGFPLLSDFEPKGAVAREYGVYRDAEGTAERALFVLDGEGVIRWHHVSPADVNPGADGIIAALEELENGS